MSVCTNLKTTWRPSGPVRPERRRGALEARGCPHRRNVRSTGQGDKLIATAASTGARSAAPPRAMGRCQFCARHELPQHRPLHKRSTGSRDTFRSDTKYDAALFPHSTQPALHECVPVAYLPHDGNVAWSIASNPLPYQGLALLACPEDCCAATC